MSFSIKTFQPNIAMAMEPESTPSDTNLLLESEDGITQAAEPKQHSKTSQETVRSSANSGLVIKSTDNVSEDYL